MYESTYSGHVKRGGKAYMVGREVMKVLATEGEIIQNKLIDKVAKSLSNIDSNTINGLVRKFLNRENGRLVKVDEIQLPHRKYWSITMLGLQQAYNEELINLHGLSKAVVRMKPKEFGFMISFYEALARSEELSRRVSDDVKEVGKKIDEYISKARSFGFEYLPIPIRFVYGIGSTMWLSILKHLSEDEGIRMEVGEEVILRVCNSFMKIIVNYEEAFKASKRLVDELYSKTKPETRSN
jgi:hypothetical protein